MLKHCTHILHCQGKVSWAWKGLHSMRHLCRVLCSKSCSKSVAQGWDWSPGNGIFLFPHRASHNLPSMPTRGVGAPGFALRGTHGHHNMILFVSFEFIPLQTLCADHLGATLSTIFAPRESHDRKTLYFLFLLSLFYCELSKLNLPLCPIPWRPIQVHLPLSFALRKTHGRRNLIFVVSFEFILLHTFWAQSAFMSYMP